MTATLALFFALSAGTAYAATYLVTSNSQVAPNTIAGHRAPAGTTPNLVPGSVNVADLAPADPWRNVAALSSNRPDPCSASATLSFCGDGTGSYDPQMYWWQNAGGSFAPAAVSKDVTGRVHLRGLVTVSGNPTVEFPASETMLVPIFVLPAGYRPAHELVMPTVWNDTDGTHVARVDITPDGKVLAYSPRVPTYLSLDGMSFAPGE